MRDLVLVMIIAVATYVLFGPKRYRSDIVDVVRADASEIVRADGTVPMFLPEGSMITSSGTGKSDVVASGTYDVSGHVQTVPTIT
jgi:hypothetical protein